MGIGMSRDRQDGRLLSLLALQVLLDYGRAGAIRPPVTAALLAANTLLYLRPGNLDALLPRLPRVLFNPHLIIEFGDLRRFLFSVFFHTSEPQLVMNMSSLLWRGGRLEEYMGSFDFASMVASLIGLSQGFTLLLSKGLLLLGDDTVYYQYSSGFSGVLLGMQVLNARAGDIVLFGVCIPAKYAELAQLFLMQALIHEVNIVGNLSGILAGLTYLWLKNGPDPLSDIANVVSQSVRFARGIVRSAARRCQSCSGRRVLASVPREVGQGMWRCTTCSHDNSRCEDVCERCSTPNEDHAFSRRRHLQDVGNGELPVEEIRARRLQRFERRWRSLLPMPSPKTGIARSVLEYSDFSY